MRNETATEGSVSKGERLCYYCNEGSCARCTGWDRTIVDGEVVEVPCAHGCRPEVRKPNQRALPEEKHSTRRSA